MPPSRKEKLMVWYNPRTKAVHAAGCKWLKGASKGKKPLNLSSYDYRPASGRFPEGAHVVSCCIPNGVSKAQVRSR